MKAPPLKASLKAQWLLATLFCLSALPAIAKLPDPSPEQAQAAAEKKAKADAQAAEDKKKLSDSMDQVTQRWRKRAAQEGWSMHPPTPVSASATPAPPGSAPVRSEKAGNAPPSADVKKPESERPK